MSSPEPRRRPTGVFTQVWDGYSLAERDRRWDAARAKAREAGFDCLFVPVGDGVNARYLTQFRASSMVLPVDGEPIAITDRGSSNAWLPAPRLTAREWSEPMAQALLDAGMERARIGVTGLRGGRFGHVSSPQGVVCHSAFAEVLRRLPDARFEDATDVLGAVRYLKSQEEIACIRRAAAIAAEGLATLRQHAGADAEVLRARVLGTMLRLGSEYYPLVLSPSTAELSAVWGTQVVTVAEPLQAGEPPERAGLPEDFLETVDSLRPGMAFDSQGLLRSIGAGDDGPVVSAGDTLRVEPNTAFTLKIGGYARPVLISNQGAELLVA